MIKIAPLASYLRKIPLVQKVLQLIPRKPLQLKVDLYRAALLLKCRACCVKSESGEPTQADVQAFSKEVDGMTDNVMDDFVHTEINKQIAHMFNALDSMNELLSQRTTDRTFAAKQRDFLWQELRYSLQAKQSSIEGAGQGVFVNSPRSIPPGTVVSLYPGLVHLKDDLRFPKYFQTLLPDNDFMLMTRIDESIIDGRTVDKVAPNPYALGHLINHCGADRKPNVIQVSFDYMADTFTQSNFPQHLHQYISNRLAQPPSMLSRLAMGPYTLVPGVVLLSTRHLHDGDELLMDYRLDPDSSTLPAWYQQHDVEEARNRWALDGSPTADTGGATAP